MKHLITEFEEKVIRLCHHDFDGLTTLEAAKQLKISVVRIRQILRGLQKKAPSLFPILTKRQAYIRDCIINEGLTHRQIAMLLDISESTVDSTILILKAKDVCFERSHKTLRYERWQDHFIKQKF